MIIILQIKISVSTALIKLEKTVSMGMGPDITWSKMFAIIHEKLFDSILYPIERLLATHRQTQIFDTSFPFNGN